MITNYRRYILVFAPILFVVTFSMDVLGHSDSISYAMCCILMGQFCYEIAAALSSISMTKAASITMKAVEVVLYTIILMYMSITGWDDCVLSMRFIVAVAVTLSFCTQTSYGFLNKPVFIFLGQISFPMYLLHIQIFQWSDYIVKDMLDLEMPDKLYYPVLYVSIVLISAVAYIISIIIAERRKRNVI